MFDLDHVFAAGGPLARSLPGFRPRRDQRRMAARVAESLEARETLIVEAGTGTGKTFAYLVPSLLSGLRVIVSTGTRTLQDQLFGRDLPLVAGAIGRPAKVALLKGRGNYLCRYRFARAVAQRTLDGFGESRGTLARIERWARVTRTGDLAEVPGLSDRSAMWSEVTSTRENCLGQRCSEFSRCHVVAARRAANEADVVVVNHHLLLADLALKEDGFGDLLGTADAVILDEAHQLPDLATQFLGAQVSSRQVEGLLGDARAELTASGRGCTTLAASLTAVEDALRRLREALPPRAGRADWSQEADVAAAPAEALADALERLHAALAAEGAEPALAACAARAAQLAAGVSRLVAATTEEAARTVETNARGFTLGLLPFDVSTRFRALMEARPSAWIFTSATLSVGDDFSHFANRLGLAGSATLRIESPFDYERQALLYVPRGLPDPASADFTAAVMAEALPLVEAARGGAFVLFTSHRALARGAALARERWGATLPFPLLVQGEAPRERLLAAFREHGHAVLLGTASFWEGVDVKGDALRLVVIEKLPFASPDDPLVRARIAFIERQEGNAFRDYQLPAAALALKQGVGRLIRSEEDHGVVVLCDPRVRSRSYGRLLLASLPPFAPTEDADEVRRFLARHAA
jgi:ATP-dependent DNA helicase DinG